LDPYNLNWRVAACHMRETGENKNEKATEKYRGFREENQET